MKGYLIELRSHNSPKHIIGSASVMRCADAKRRFQVAERLMGKSSRSKMEYPDCFIIEYEADWADMANPVFNEITKYDIGNQTSK